MIYKNVLAEKKVNKKIINNYLSVHIFEKRGELWHQTISEIHKTSLWTYAFLTIYNTITVLHLVMASMCACMISSGPMR